MLVTLAGYVGIAIENTRLYRSLQRKVEENERLQGVQREHHRVHQRRHSGGGPGRPRRELEYADGAADRNSARAGAGAAAGVAVPGGTGASSSSGRAKRAESITSTSSRCAVGECSGRSPGTNGKGVLEMPAGGREAAAEATETLLNIAVAPLVSRDEQRIGRLIIFDDVTVARRTGAAPGAGRQAELGRAAGRRRGARGEHAAGGDLDLRADAGQAGGRRRAASRRCSTRSPSRPSAPARSSTRC